MLFLATLLAFSSLLLSPVQAETFVVVNFTLRCDYPDSFIYTATLAELDNFPWAHDLIAKNGGQGSREIRGYLAGEDTGDASPHFEFHLQIEHNCGGMAKRTTEIELPYCSAHTNRCVFPVQTIDL